MLLLIKEEDEHISLLHDVVNDLRGVRHDNGEEPDDPHTAGLQAELQ
jgi:hypothetical protein